LVNEHPFLAVRWDCKGRTGQVATQLVGVYNFENILSAIAVGDRFGVAPEQIADAIANYNPDNSRSQLIRKGDNTVLLDAYNANPTSMEAALKNFSAMSGPRKSVCIGDMAELGEESEKEHERIAGLVAACGFDQVVLVGKQFGKFASRMACIHFDDSEKAAAWVSAHPFKGATVLIKGSRSTRMERILDVM
jgi:UDP-N-acetylmuramoyl-tripeptide--D-alanyl-D-alanine ligase